MGPPLLRQEHSAANARRHGRAETGRYACLGALSRAKKPQGAPRVLGENIGKPDLKCAQVPYSAFADALVQAYKQPWVVGLRGLAGAGDVKL